MNAIHQRLLGLGLAAASVLLAPGARAEEAPPPASAPTKDRATELKDRTATLARRMDDLSAEAQDLIWNHTNPKLTEFLKSIDDAMLDARDLLEGYRTDGETVAAEQDVLEKIYEAAKKAAQKSGGQQQQPQQGDQQQQGQGQGQQGQGQGQPGQGQGQQQSQQEQENQQGMQAMLQMMEQMLGIGPQDQPGSQGNPQGNQPGQGLKNGPGTGSGNAALGPHDKRMVEERTVPKAAGNPSGLTPPEYRDQIESFHRAMDELDKKEARSAPAPAHP